MILLSLRMQLQEEIACLHLCGFQGWQILGEGWKRSKTWCPPSWIWQHIIRSSVYAGGCLTYQVPWKYSQFITKYTTFASFYRDSGPNFLVYPIPCTRKLCSIKNPASGSPNSSYIFFVTFPQVPVHGFELHNFFYGGEKRTNKSFFPGLSPLSTT